ncbi:tripartite tricarboxylate transporter substrate binding protein [Blastococcus montanus]|uniref:Bug family tripartite tricarboxylate transporter substrate binding protein n=1 Tax=Blastococcus montanus TaxID=3144973 RepID=UPI0032089764
MTQMHRVRRGAAAGLGVATALALTACGGNLGGGESADAESFPDGPITILVGFDPGGSTDLIGRAVADGLSDELGVPVSVENRPGANGAVAAQQFLSAEPDGQTLMVINGSLAYITPMAVSEDEVVDINDFEVITGLSLDDYVLVTSPSTGFTSLEDVANADRTVTYGTAGVGTGSQLSSELLFNQLDVEATAVPFDGGSPTLTAVLGGQVDVGSIQLGEAIEQIESGELVPLVTFAEERPEYLPDTPTAIEAGYDVPVQQSRALVAPEGTPEEIVDQLQEATQAVFETEQYQQFNENNLLTPNEIDGEELQQRWTENLESYRSLVDEYGIDLGGAQ